ncbi:MAG: hypothetical protein ACJ761_11380 [Chloroflexota bacterium]
MNAEFNWWLLIVGLVVGAGLTWLVVSDTRRRESDVDDEELPREAAWLSAALRDEGEPISPEAAERLLRLHRTYLSSLPPDDPDADDTWPAGSVGSVVEPVPTHPSPAPRSARDDAPMHRDAAQPEPPIRDVRQPG